MPGTPHPLCRICRTNVGIIREHLSKRTDLKALFERSSRGGPYYFSDARRLNKIVQGSARPQLLIRLSHTGTRKGSVRIERAEAAWPRSPRSDIDGF
jgi:hypothetical protein